MLLLLEIEEKLKFTLKRFAEVDEDIRLYILF